MILSNVGKARITRNSSIAESDKPWDRGAPVFVVVLLFLVLFLSLASLKLLLVRASRASASTNRRNVALVMSLPHISVGKGMSDLFGGCIFLWLISDGTGLQYANLCFTHGTERLGRYGAIERERDVKGKVVLVSCRFRTDFCVC